MPLKFGTSGVRGPVEAMTDRECALFTAAFLDYLQGRERVQTVVLGGDFRGSTPRILRAVAFGIRQSGACVCFGGFVPTPALMHYAVRRHQPSIMVTGSHIPDDRNGIKFNLPTGEVLKRDETEILRRYGRLKAAEEEDRAAGRSPFTTDGELRAEHVRELGEPEAAVAGEYMERYLKAFAGDCLAGMKVVVYQHSAVIRALLPDLLARLGAEVVTVGWSDRFVPVDTEAVDDPERLAGWVREHRADALVSADGDSDRPLVVDEQGRVIRGDVLGILTAVALEADAVATPVSCNSALELCGRFGSIRRTRIGSPYVIEAMEAALAEGAARVVGYEANGGFLLGSDLDDRRLTALPTRDAALPILTVLDAARQAGRPLSALVDELPPRFTCSGLLRQVPSDSGKAMVINLDQQREILAEALFGELGSVERWDFTDGARMTLADGGVLHLRPSGNAPEFRVYTEAAEALAAETLNEAAQGVLRQAFDRFREAGRFLEADARRRANIELMHRCPRVGQGMDIIIVSTTNPVDEAWWQARLEATRGQIANPDAIILAVCEDWPGGAGNGLGTLYALRLAGDLARARHGIDLLERLREGAAIAIYHTAGKGTRLAPLPASEANNKPAVKLPGLVEVAGERLPITVLESVIRQTGIHAASRRGRLSVIWGDQVFVPACEPGYMPTHHVDIVGQLGPMPDAAAWEQRGLANYGLLALDAAGNASQVEKVTHDAAAGLAARGAIHVEGGIAISIGSFSLSAALTQALLDAFAGELDRREGRFDTDPHFWMPMTLDLETYLEIMAGKGTAREIATDHHRRLRQLANRLLADHPELGLLGVVNVGIDSYWWDYGQLGLYCRNVLLVAEESAEGAAARAFFGIGDRQEGSRLGSVEVAGSCVRGSRIGGGRIRRSILVNVDAEEVDIDESVVICVTAPAIRGRRFVAYNIADGEPIALGGNQVRADVVLDGEVTTMHGDSDGGRDAWETLLPGNPCTFAELHERIRRRLGRG